MARTKNNATIHNEREGHLAGIPDDPGWPEGSRKKLVEGFLAELNRSWQQHGRDLLDRLSAERPKVLFRAMVKLAAHSAKIGQPNELHRKHRREEVLQRLAAHQAGKHNPGLLPLRSGAVPRQRSTPPDLFNTAAPPPQ